jgi:hypothetical protein
VLYPAERREAMWVQHSEEKESDQNPQVLSSTRQRTFEWTYGWIFYSPNGIGIFTTQDGKILLKNINHSRICCGQKVI